MGPSPAKNSNFDKFDNFQNMDMDALLTNLDEPPKDSKTIIAELMKKKTLLPGKGSMVLLNNTSVYSKDGGPMVGEVS